MDEIAGFRGRGTFSPRAPADFANARQDVGNRLLLAMMVNSRAGSRLDLEQPAPQHRVDAELWRDRCQAHRAWRLRRFLVEPGRADNADGGIGCHHVHEELLADDLGVASVRAARARSGGNLHTTLHIPSDLTPHTPP